MAAEENSSFVFDMMKRPPFQLFFYPDIITPYLQWGGTNLKFLQGWEFAHSLIRSFAHLFICSFAQIA